MKRIQGTDGTLDFRLPAAVPCKLPCGEYTSISRDPRRAINEDPKTTEEAETFDNAAQKLNIRFPNGVRPIFAPKSSHCYHNAFHQSAFDLFSQLFPE